MYYTAILHGSFEKIEISHPPGLGMQEPLVFAPAAPRSAREAMHSALEASHMWRLV